MSVFWKSIFCTSLLSLLFDFSCSSMENENIVNQSYFFSPSLNFTYNDKVAIDDEGLYNSDRVFDWHIDQAPILTVAYQNYQKAPRRNVQKLMVSIIYSKKDEIKIKNIQIDEIFINGFQINDTPINKDISGGLVYNHNFNSTYSYDINNFISFNYNGTNNLQKAKEIGLVKDDTILRELKVKMHSETISMVYLKDKFDEIITQKINSLLSEEGIIVKDIILNMASFRDMCLECSKIKTQENEIGNFFNNHLLPHFLKKINEIQKNDDVKNIFVFSSWISKSSDQSKNYYDNFPQNNWRPINIRSGESYLIKSKNPYSAHCVRDENGNYTEHYRLFFDNKYYNS